jgi:hypothetical protein
MQNEEVWLTVVPRNAVVHMKTRPSAMAALFLMPSYRSEQFRKPKKPTGEANEKVAGATLSPKA